MTRPRKNQTCTLRDNGHVLVLTWHEHMQPAESSGKAVADLAMGQPVVVYGSDVERIARERRRSVVVR